MTEDNVIDIEAPFGRKKDGTPKKPSGFQRGGAEYRPASGIPASGALPHPPRPGNGNGKAGKDKLIPLHPSHPDKAPLVLKNKIDRAAASEEAFSVTVELMRDPEQHPMTRLAAARDVQDRVDGKAIQRVIAGEVRTVEEIRTADPIEASREYQRLMK